MYFKEKEDTNIDKEFEKKQKFSLKNLFKKPMIFILGGVLLLIILIIIVSFIMGNSNKNRLELFGDERILIRLGDDYIEPGYKAYDKDNNDRTHDVVITSTVDTTKVGEYEILYSFGGINKVRYVEVVEQEQETFIVLYGEQNMHIKVGDVYTEPGFSVTDIVDGDLTQETKVKGKVDTSKKGVYKITYTVTNSRNLTTSKIRYVVVE